MKRKLKNRRGNDNRRFVKISERFSFSGDPICEFLMLAKSDRHRKTGARRRPNLAIKVENI